MTKKLLTKNICRILLSSAVMLIFVCGVNAQKVSVTGTVMNADGQPIPGATIIEKGTVNGTVSNLEGEFSLDVTPNSTLRVSFVGMLSQDIPIGDRRVFDVSLEVDAIGLEEVIAIGYGTRSKQALTGSVVNVDAEELKKLNPVNDITNALQGMVPGVVTNSGNTPGSSASIQIRGIGTINNSSPLIVVDGVPSSISRLNPAEIKTMTVLKDAASTAIYGSAGANGVILVETIEGNRSQKPTVTINARTGISAMPPQYDMLTPTEFGEMLWLSFENSGIEPNHPMYGNGASPYISKYIYPAVTDNVDLNDYHAYDYQIVESTPEGTNWFDEIYQNAMTQDYDVSITGGTEKARYAVVFGYTDNEGMVKESGFDRFNFRINSDLKLADWLEVGENFGVRHQNDWGRQSDGGEGSSVAMTMLMPRLCPVYDVEGNWAPVTKLAGFSSNRNEPSEIWRQKDYTRKYLSLEGNVYANARFLKAFTAETRLGVYGGNGWNNSPTEANPWNYSGTTKDMLSVSSSNARSWNWTNTLTFIKEFGDHIVNAMAGFEAASSRSESMAASREEYFLQTEEYFVLSAGEGTQTNSGGYSETSSASYFGRLHYEFKTRYYFDGVIRHDGSSVFAKKYRWGTFPSFAAGWILSEEDFMSSVSWLDLLKIRASWGQSGNNRIGTYNGFSVFQTNLNYSYYPIDGSNNSLTSGFESRGFGNPNAKWETTTTINVGLDLSLLKRLSFGLDVWQRDTEDMLYPKAIPAVYGYASAPSVNIGDMRNTGFDLWIDYKGRAFNNDLRYDVNLNISHYKNELINLSDKEGETRFGSTYRDQYYTFAMKGTAYPEFYGYEVEGIFQTDAEANAHATNELDPTYNKAGHFKFADVNGDNVINSDDRTSIGNPHPDLTVGLNISLGYKNFDLLATIYSSIGNEVLNLNNRILDFNYMEFWRGTKRLYNSWGSPYLDNNADAEMPIAEINDQVSQLPSSYYVEDGSYVRLRNLQLGYTLPRTTMQNLGIDQVRLYVVGQNLLTITGYTGLDPAFYSGGINYGIDTGRWPSIKSYMLGLNLTF